MFTDWVAKNVNRFSKSLITDVLKQFLVQLIGLNGLTLASQLTRLIEVLSQFGLNIENVLLPLIFLVVTFLPLTIPLAFLFAIVIVLNQSQQNGELTAIQALGVSPMNLAKPLLVFAVLLFGFGAVTGLYLDPWGQKEFRKFFIKKSQTEIDSLVKVQLRPGIFTDRFINHVFYAGKIDRDNLKFTNLVITPKSQSASPFVLFASSGQITGSVESGSLKFMLKNPYTYSYSEGYKKLSTSHAKSMELDLLKIFQSEIVGRQGRLNYTTFFPGELQTYYQEKNSLLLQEQQKKNPDLKVIKKLKRSSYGANYLWHFRLAGSFIVFGFSMLGLRFVLGENVRGRSYLFVKVIGLVLLTYFLIMAMRWLAESGLVDAGVAVWTANILVTLFGLWKIRQLQHSVTR